MTLRRLAAALLGLVAAACLAVAAGYLVLDRWLDRPLAVGEAPLTIDVPAGQPFAATTRDLGARGVLDHPQWLRAYARMTGADARVQAGEYEIRPGTTPRPKSTSVGMR